MKKIIIILLTFIISSCSHITENIIDNNFSDDSLEVGVKNNTPYLFKRTEISNNDHTYIYQQIESYQFSEFQTYNYVHSNVMIRIETDDKIFYKSPNTYDENSIVNTGTYYFEVSLTSDGDDIVVVRKSL